MTDIDQASGDPARALEQPDAFSLWMNALPCLHLVSGLMLALAWLEPFGALLMMLAWLYLLPPIACRSMLLVFGRPNGRLTQDMTAYRVWWTATQLQMVFNRVPWIEELLRLVPGLYALWIALWGGRLSPRAFVSPGVTITDRYLVDVGPGAVLGIKVVLAGHAAERDQAGRWLVVVAPPVVEAEAIMGGATALGPGARLQAGSLLPTGRRIGPFSSWPRQAELSHGH